MLGDERRQWYNWRLNPNRPLALFVKQFIKYTTDYTMTNMLLTDDFYMKETGVLHPLDEEVFKAAGGNPKVMSVVDLIKAIQNGELEEEDAKEFEEQLPPGSLRLDAQSLEVLGRAAVITESHFAAHVMQHLKPEKAKYVRKLRCEMHYTWRSVAQACFDEWGGSWEPPSNQLMGRELCIQSAKMLGEDSSLSPWN